MDRFKKTYNQKVKLSCARPRHPNCIAADMRGTVLPLPIACHDQARARGMATATEQIVTWCTCSICAVAISTRRVSRTSPTTLGGVLHVTNCSMLISPTSRDVATARKLQLQQQQQQIQQLQDAVRTRASSSDCQRIFIVFVGVSSSNDP
jgi:hypothetical protein